MMQQYAIDIRALDFAYEAEQVLTGIELSVKLGEFLAIIGPNGGGKTTLLRLMLGILPKQSGSISINGLEPTQARRFIGYVPQCTTIRPDFPASVLDTVLMGGATSSLTGGKWDTSKKARQTAGDYLTTLGLAGVMHRPLHALSGGQRQRALVARALMSRVEDAPFTLLLDEPTSSIDPQGKFCFYDFLNKLRGLVTIVVVSHDLMLASPFFSSIAFVNNTLTRLPGGALTPELLISLYGSHQHLCPVADLQHAQGLSHSEGCTHPTCAPFAADSVQMADFFSSPSPKPETGAISAPYPH